MTTNLTSSQSNLYHGAGVNSVKVTQPLQVTVFFNLSNRSLFWWSCA